MASGMYNSPVNFRGIECHEKSQVAGRAEKSPLIL